MSSENENEQSNNNSSGVKKQVRIVNDLVSSDDCPRLSVRPGRDSYSGYKYSVWAGVPTIPCKPKPHRISTSGNSKLKQRINKVNKSLCVSGFFRAQLRMMKSSKHHRNKGMLSSNISVNNQFSDNITSRSISCPVLDKGKGKMTLFEGYSSVPKKQMFEGYSPILKKHVKTTDNLNGRRIHDLPKELLAEILKRLPVKYILRCRAVQKSWHSFLQSPSFITLQSNYQKNNIITTTNASDHHYKYLFFDDQRATHKFTIRFDDVQCREYCKIVFPPSLPKNSWVSVSYGLVCVSSTLNDIEDEYNRNIYLWNPLVQKYKTLPNSPLPSKQDWEEWEALAFGFLPEVNDYVVVHIIKHPPSRSFSIGVYSLNNNSWKKLRRDNVSISRLSSDRNDVVFANGAAYWLGLSHRKKILMCFDTKTDILSEFSLPDWLDQDYFPVIYPFGQSIAYFVWEYKVPHFDMWILNDNPINEVIWEKKMCVSISEDVREEVLGVRNNGEPILAKYNNLIAYNLDRYEASEFVHSWDRWAPGSIFVEGCATYVEGCAQPYIIYPFVESLVLFNIDGSI